MSWTPILSILPIVLIVGALLYWIRNKRSKQLHKAAAGEVGASQSEVRQQAPAVHAGSRQASTPAAKAKPSPKRKKKREMRRRPVEDRAACITRARIQKARSRSQEGLARLGVDESVTDGIVTQRKSVWPQVAKAKRRGARTANGDRFEQRGRWTAKRGHRAQQP